MLSDFLTLEAYFGCENAALSLEDLTKRYGHKRTINALKKGDLTCRASCAQKGSLLVWLTEQGRQKALP